MNEIKCENYDCEYCLPGVKGNCNRYNITYLSGVTNCPKFAITKKCDEYEQNKIPELIAVMRQNKYALKCMADKMAEIIKLFEK